MNLLIAAASWECETFWAQNMQHITLSDEAICIEKGAPHSLSCWIVHFSERSPAFENRPCNLGCLSAKPDKMCHGLSCPEEHVSCKCRGTEYLFPYEYYDCCQRTQPDWGRFFTDHVGTGTWGSRRGRSMWKSQCVSNRVMLFCNTKCLLLSL